MLAIITKVKLSNADYMPGVIVASGSCKFILYTAFLFSLVYEYLCSTTKHYYNYIWCVSVVSPEYRMVYFFKQLSCVDFRV